MLPTKLRFVVTLPRNAAYHATDTIMLYLPSVDIREYIFPCHIDIWATVTEFEAKEIASLLLEEYVSSVA